MIWARTTLITVLALALTASAATNSTNWPKKSDIPRFTPDLLASNTLEAAREFSSRSGTNRFEEAEILDRDLAPGISLTKELDPKWLMTEDDVENLLGRPDGRKHGQWLRYNIGKRDGKSHALLFDFKNGYLHSIYESATE
ncbi:MAG TPA: hypothetical protein PLE77_12180 [Kiritimatiellia bacterium]|nr:hypothetical protein [Kiritimatiellia bacterium]